MPRSRLVTFFKAVTSIIGAGLLLASCGGDDGNLDTSGLFTYEEAQPVISISGPAFTNANVGSGSLQYQIVIEDVVEGELSSSDPNSIRVTNAGITALVKEDVGNLDAYTLYIEPDIEATDGDIVITIPEGAVVAQIGDGRFPNAATSFVVEYDNAAPSVDITIDDSVGNVFLEQKGLDDVSNDDYYVVNGNFSVLLKFNEEVTGLTAGDIDLSVSGVNVVSTVALSGGMTYRVDISLEDSNTLADNTDILFVLSAGAVEDISGDRTEAQLEDHNISGYEEVDGYPNARSEYLITLDRSAPTAVVGSVPTAVDYTRFADFDLEGVLLIESVVPLKAGDSLELVLEFSESIIVSGIPYIPLGIDSLLNDANVIELEKKALYASLGENSQGVENAAATFIYTIEAGANLIDTDGINSSPSSADPQLIFADGAYFSDKYANTVYEDITLSPSFSLSDLQVDTIAPEVTDITWSADGHIYASESEGGRFSVDEIVTFNLSFSEVIYPNSLSESASDYSFAINLKNGDSVTPVVVPGTRHIVEAGSSVLQFEFLIEEGNNAVDGLSYVDFSGPEQLFGDKAGNFIDQDITAFTSRTEDEINIFIDADLPDLLSMAEISKPAASSTTSKDDGINYYVGANYKTDDAETIILQLSFSEPVHVSKIDPSEAYGVNLIAYFKDNSAAETADNTYSFTYTGALDELNTTLLFEYEVIPFSEPGVTNDDLDGIELDYLLLENAAIRDDYGNSIVIDSSDDLNLVYRTSVTTGDIDLSFIKSIYIETTPAEIIGISFTGVDNGAEMLNVLGEGSSVEVVLTFDQPVEFYYSLSGGASSRPSLAMEIVEGTEPNLVSDHVVYAHYSGPGLDEVEETHTFTYTIQADDSNDTLSSIWLLRNSVLADNGGYDDLMVITGSSVYDQRGRNVQEGFSSSAIKDYIFADGYARHPLISLQTGIEPIALFTRPAGYDTDTNDYLIYPLADSSGINFTLKYGASESDISNVQVRIEAGGDVSDLPYLLLYGDLIDATDADGDGVADSSERWEARAYLSLDESGNASNTDDGIFNALVFILTEPEDPANGFAAQYFSSESLGLIYDSLVIGDSYSITTLQGNPIQTDISKYTYSNDAAQTLSTVRERVFYDPNPRIISIVELPPSVPGDKNYNLGEEMLVAVTVSEDIVVSGSGSIRLYLSANVLDQDLTGYYSDSSIALEYQPDGSSERELIFAYQVEKDKYADQVALHSDSSLRAIETTGSASITDLSAAGRELREFTEGLSLIYVDNIVSTIDSRAPRIASISMARIPRGSSTEEPITGNDIVTFVSEDTMVFHITMHTEAVIGTSELTSIFGSPYVDAFAADGGAGANGIGPRLQLEIDPGSNYSSTSTTRYATYDSHVTGTGSSSPARSDFFYQHKFKYQVTSEDHDSTGIKIIGPLDDSIGIFKNIPNVADPADQNEANYSLRGALEALGMAADSNVEEYEFSHVVVDNYPTLVGFHIDTTDDTTSYSPADLRFTPDRFSTIQFYAIINQADKDKDTANTTVKLPFSIYDSSTGDIEDFSATYVDWTSTADSNIDITDIENYYPVSSSNYSAFLFTFNFANASKAQNVNADTLIIPENPFQNQPFTPKNNDGIAVNLSLAETVITDVNISGVSELIIDFRPPEISAVELPAAGLYYHSTSASSTMSELRYRLTFSEPVYATNLTQYPAGTPLLYQRIGSGAETNATCASDACINASANGVGPGLLVFSDAEDAVDFTYSIDANDSGYIDSFYVLGGPDDSVNDGSVNVISDAYGNELNGYTLPEFSTDGRDLSDSDSIGLLVDNSELFITAVTLPEAAIYQAGDEINLSIEFSRAVELEQSGVNFPMLSFLLGSQDSNYSEGNTSALFRAPYDQQSHTLTFSYEVESSLGRDDYDGIQLSPAVIDWNGASLKDVLRPTETIDTTATEMTDLSSFLASDVLTGVNIDVVYPELEVSELQLAANQDNAADNFSGNDYHYYLNSDLVFNLTFNEPVVIPSSAGEYQSFIKFAYADSDGTEYERSVRFDPEAASSTLAQYGQSWDYDSGSSADVYFVYEVGSADASSASNANGFIADGYLRLSDINLSGIVDRSGKQLLLGSQLAITPSTAVIDLDKTSIYSYNLFAVDASNQVYDLYAATADADPVSGVLTDERYITSGQDLVIEFSFRHHPSEDPSQVIFDLGGNSGLFLEVDIDNGQGAEFLATLQEDDASAKSYSDGTSSLRYLLDLSSYTDTNPLSDLDGIGITFHDDDVSNGVYKDQSGPVNLAFAEIFLDSLELINVDTQGPSIEAVYMQPSATGLTMYYGAGDEFQITVQFSEPIAISTGTFNDIDLSFSLYDVDSSSAEPRTAGYLSSDSNRSYIFTYLVDATADAAFEQIYFDSVELAHTSAPDITTVIGDTRADPNPLTSATFTYDITSAAVQGHAIDFNDPSIASLIIPAGDASSKTIKLGGGDALALTMVTSREVAFADDSQPRLRLLADSTPVTFHYAGDYNASIFALSHTFTYAVGTSIETNSSGLYIPADALRIDNSGALDIANNSLNSDLNISTGSTQFDTGGTAWANNPTEYIFIDSLIPEFAQKYIPPQSLFLEYTNTSYSIEFNSSHAFTLDTVNGSGFPAEFSGGFVAGSDSGSTAVDFTRPVYQATVEGTDWYIWSSTTDGYYRISTSDPYSPWLFSRATNVASIQDVFIPGTVTEFGLLSSSNNAWYLVDNANTTDFSSNNSYTLATISATLTQRYLIDETLHVYLVLSEQVQVADELSSEGDYGDYPAYSLSYTNSYDGSNTDADLPLTFSHWLATSTDAGSAANKQVMVYSNELNSSTVNRNGTGVQPALQLQDGATLAIRDLFGNALPINDDNTSISVYQEAEDNNINGVQLRGYLVPLDSVSLYQLTSANQTNAVDPDLTYIIGDQLVLDLTFGAELTETSYDPSQDLFLTLMFNDASSKEHILGDGDPSAGAGAAAGDLDQRYWYNSDSGDYDDNDGDGDFTRADYEADINNTSAGYNNVLRYIFTISDRADGDDFNTLEEGVSDPNLSITGLSFSEDLVDEYGSRVDTDGVLSALSAVSLPITIDSIRPQIYLNSTASDGGDYIELADFTTYSRDDYLANLNANISQHPSTISFTLSFTEPIVMPARSSLIESGESDFSSGLRFQVLELDGVTVGERNASSAYVPYSGTGSAPEYHTNIFTYAVQDSDDSGISAIDINATIYDLAGNPNYYSSADSNDTHSNSGFAGSLYSGIELDGDGPSAAISDAGDVALKVVQPGGDPSIPLDQSVAPGPYGVGTTLYFEIAYDQSIHTSNLASAAEDISLWLQPATDGSAVAVAARIIASQLDSYDSNSDSSGSIANRRLTFTYALSALDVSDVNGYRLHSLDYSEESARYGILDSYGNGINDGGLTYDIYDNGITIATDAIDTKMPTIDKVTVIDASGSVPTSDTLYGGGDTLSFALAFSEAVALIESDFYAADNGLRFKIEPSIGDASYRVAAYAGSQTDETTFTFTYVVGSTEGEIDKGDVYLDDMTLLGNTYDTALNLETNLTYDANSSDSGHDVDSGAPVVTALSIKYQPSGGSSFDAIQEGTAYTLGIGTTLRFSLTFDEAISFDVNSTGAVVPYLELKAVDSAIATPQRIRAELTAEANATIGNGSASSLAFTFVVGQGDSNSSDDNNATQQSLYNTLEIFSIQNGNQIQDLAGNVLSGSVDYALTDDPFETIHPDGIDPEADALGDTMIYIDSVRPQITLLALDKSSAETYGFGEDIALSISFSEALNESDLDSSTNVSRVVMHLERTEPAFIDPDRLNFAYTFSKQDTRTDALGTEVAYILTSASQGSAGKFVNFVYEGQITGEYNLTGNIRDLGGNAIDPADLNIYTDGSVSKPTSLSAVSPTATVDHLAPRPLATSVRLSGGGVPESNSSSPYKLGDIFVFTITFHEELALVNHDDDLANLQLDLDFDANSTDRSIPLGSIPAGDPTKLYFTYTVSDGDQALTNGHSLALHGLSPAASYNTLAIVDAYGNSVDPSSIDFSYYDLDGNGSVDDANNDGVVDLGDENFTILQPDYNLSIDGIRPYWVSIESSYSNSVDSGPYILGHEQNITFTLTASEELSATESGMQLLLDLQPENANLGAAQIRSVGGAFYGAHTSNDSTDDNYSIITFVYTVGVSDPADNLGDGIDHLAFMASSAYQYGTIVTQDLAGNQVLENDFSLIAGFEVTPADETLSYNQVKFDTTPPIIESVSIDGFDPNNLAIDNTLVSFTLHFQDDDLDTVSIDGNRSDINLSLLNLATDYNRTSETNATLPLDKINADSLVFSGPLDENISWGGTFSLQIIDGNSTIVDKAEPANAMTSELVVGSGSDDLAQTYYIDTAPPRIANLNEIDSTLYTPITAAVGGYGPGRQATFLVTFNEELSSISGNGNSTAQLLFFIYDEDASAGTSAIALRARAALASGGNSDLTYIEDADGNKRSVARFYYTVNEELNSTASDYDGGPIYLNYSDVTSDPTTNDDYFRCFDGSNITGATTSGVTDCYVALSAQLKDINLNTATYSFSDNWVYAFNRTGDTTIEPMELTRFVTDPLEYIGYKIRVTPTGADRAWGYDANSTDNDQNTSSTLRATDSNPIIALNPDKPYIGASETEDSAGDPGYIYFIIEPGPEVFRLDTTAPVDVNLTFSIASAPNEDYIATYLDSNNEYITFEFNLGDFGSVEYDSNITLHSISQNASMEYSDASGVYVLADSHFYPSLDLDKIDSYADQQFDTGLRLDMVKPELLSVIAYQEPVLGDSNFSIPVTSNSYLGRDAQVVLRFSFSENLGSVQTTAGNSKITLPLDLDTGPIVIEQGTPQDDNRSDPNDDFSTFDITYSVGDIHAGSINNDHFALDAIVSDQNGNTITGDDLNISRTIAGFTSPQVNGDYPEFFDVNIYRRINLQSVSSEVYDPIPDLDAGITDYTLIGDDDFYIAATFTYTLDALQDVYPDFQEYDHDNDPHTDATIESNYSFSSQVSGSSLANAQYLATFSDANTSDGANVLLFSYGIALANDPADSAGNYLLLDSLSGLNDASKIRDIYGNRTSSYIPDFAADTVTRIDSTAPILIGATHVVAAGQDAGKVNYGPLDSNITFALTFNEVIDSTESFKNLQLTFYMDANNSYYDRTIRQGTSTAVIEEGVPDPASGYAQGQIVNMIYLLDSTDGGTINVAAAGQPMAVSGDVYDYHNGEEGNKASISMDINNSSDINSNFYIPVLTIDQTSILPARWSVEATSTSGNQVFTPYGSNHPAGLVWESNASGSGSNSNIGDARVGIGNTLSFIIDYATEIRADSLYADSDTTGSSPDSVLSSANNVRLAFSDGSGSATYYAAIDEVYNDPDPNVNSSSLIFTYKIEAALGLDLEDLAFVNVEIPPDTTIRSSAFNEIIISGIDFAQATTAAIDATYPQIYAIDVYHRTSETYYEAASKRRYFGENDYITFRVEFSEELIDDNTSDNTPDFAISWTMLDDEDNTTMRYFDSSGTGIATSDVNHSSGKTIYDLIFPVELESNGALTLGDYQGLIQFSVNSPTIVFADSLGVIQDKAYNSQQSLTYVVAADRNASNSNNYAVDFIRPRLQYIESHSSAVTDSSYTEYESVGGAALTHYYGQLDLSFYVVHDSELSINTTNASAQPELSLRIPSTSGDVELNLSLLGNNTSAWPSSGSLTENALGYKLEIADEQSALTAAAGGTFDGIVSFAKILNATNYSDKPGNYAYFQLVENGTIQYVYGGDDLTLDGYSSAFYSPTLDTTEDHAYPMPSIYIDTTPPSFSIASQQKIELTNRALIFELTLDDPLSDLELSQAFNTDSNSSYHSAPTYELSWSKSSGGTERYEGMLYDGSGGRDLGNNQVAPFTFTLFTDAGTDTLTAASTPDASADYATYLDDLQDSFTHTFTMDVTDFVGNSHSVTFDVEKGTDEFLGYLTGWDDSGSGAEYDTVSQDGQIKLADNATSATFAVSFITAIDETTLDAADFKFEYSTGGDDDISGLSIASIASNGSTTAANDYLITASGGNLPLAAGQLTLAFADSPSIEILGGGTYFDLNLISDENQSFAYSKDFNFSIDSVAQLNPSAVGEVPELEINFVAPDTGGSSSLTIEGYKLYYALDSAVTPDTSSAYFSSLEHSGFSSGANGAQTFANNCLPIFADPVLGVSSQEYSFRVVAQYSLDGNKSSIYETHINRGSTEAIELNATMPSYVAGTTLALPYCSRATIAADAANIAANFGRGLALSRDVSGDPLRNLLASGQYQSSNSNDGGAIRHYVRTGAEFAASSGSTSGLELATSEAVEFGHNLAFPSATFSGYDLFIAGDPFFTDSSTNNSGYVQLFHKSSSANDWIASDSISSSNADTASGAAVAIAVNGNGSNAFALYGEPRHDGDSGRVVVMKFNSSGTWTQAATANTSNTSISGDSLFGSAIAVSADGDIVAIMSSEGVHIFSLSSNNGALTYLHSIAAIDVLGVGNSFVGANASVNYGQALAIQKTELNDTYLLAIGLPHDSHSVGGIIYGSGTNGVNTATAGNYGGVLLLTTTTGRRAER